MKRYDYLTKISELYRFFIKRILVGLVFYSSVLAQTTTEFQVTNNGFSSYLIDGVSNPSLSLIKGSTYIFHVSAPGHPFWIKTVQSTGTGSAYESGVTGNGTDQGDVTFAVPMDTPDQLFYDCEFHESRTGSITLATVVSIQTNDGLAPAIFSLKQNYPNPLNPITTLRYDLPKQSHVTLTIYDLLGRQVKMLVNQTQDAGFKSIQWDASSVPSGIYFYQINVRQKEGGQAGDFIQTRKMILLK
ncbi:MAG: T9SS type A sorting domain-containing protein [Nitrosopumilus sp.]